MEEFIIKYWLQFIFGLVITLLSAWCKHLHNLIKKKQLEEKEEEKKKSQEYEALKVGVMSLLHDRLFQSCSYYLELGFIPVERAEEVIDNVDMIYNAYHGLNGNGTGTQIHEKFGKLHVEHRDTEELPQNQHV